MLQSQSTDPESDSSNNSCSDTYSDETIGGLCTPAMLNLVFLIVAKVAVSHSASALVLNACGAWLRGTIVADIVCNTGLWLLVLWATKRQSLVCVTAAVVLLVSAPLSALTLQSTLDAHSSPACIGALSGQAGETNQELSPATENPLLINIGYCYGALYSMGAVASCATAGVLRCRRMMTTAGERQ